MRRLALLLLVLSGCVDLTRPRAYQCDPGGNTLEESVRQANCRSSASSSWYCALDGFCRDRAQPSSRECEADTHCPANHRCLPTEDSVRVLRCRSVEQTGTFRCRADAGDSDCGPGAKCSFEGLCRPTTAQAFTCRRDAGDADCEGGWRCGLDAVCRAPSGGPNRCDTDLDCDEGWRCGGERCVDPRDEQLLPLVQPQAPVKLNPLVDFFRDGGGVLLVSPPATIRDGQTRLVFREGLPLHRVDQLGERVLVDTGGVTPRLRPGWRAALGPTGLLQVSGTQLEFTLANDGGTSLFDGGYRLTSVRALAGPAVEGLFGWTIDDGPVSAAAISNGHETLFLPDAGVHLVGMTSFSKPGCAPAFVTWSTTTLYLVTSTNGFRPTSVVVSGSDLERVTLDALVDGGAVAAKRSIVDVHSSEGGLAVVYHQASQVAPVDVDGDGGAEASSGMVRVAALAPSGCGLSGAVSDVEACPNAPGARLTAAVAAVDGAGLEVQRVCAGGALEWRYARNQFVVSQRTLTTQSTSSFAVALRSGVLAVGAGPSTLVGTTTSEPVQVVIDEPSGLTVFASDRAYSTSTALGLGTTLSARDATSLIRARLPFGRMTTILRSGLVLDREADGGIIFLGGAPEGAPLVSAATLVPPALLAATAGDGLWTLTLDPAAPSLLQVRARPVPGFPITSMALRRHQAGGVFEGYLITANRLFTIDAPSLNRVNVTEVVLGREDPVQVWFDGADGQSRARLLVRNGELRSLPGLLMLAPSPGRDEAVEATTVCRSTVQLTSSGVFHLESPDGGTGRWQRVEGLPTDAGLPFESGRLVPMDGGAVVSFPSGLVWRLPFVCR